MTSWPAAFDERVDLARRLFEQGRKLPPALLDDTVVRSWERSRDHGLSLDDRVLFNPVSRSDVRHISEQCQPFLADIAVDMEALFRALGPAHWIVACMERRGRVVRTLSNGSDACRALEPAFRPGVNLNERVVGTTGPGCALAEGRPVVVCGSEHFLEEARVFACASVPIRDPQGQVTGVLNVSRRHHGQRIGILEPLALAVRQIEQRMVQRLGGEFRIALHYRPELLASPLRGLLHFDADGRLLGANPVARDMLDLAPAGVDDPVHFKQLFELPPDRWATQGDVPVVVTCRNGLRLFGVHAFLTARPRSRPVAAVTAVLPESAEAPLPFLQDTGLSRSLGQAQRAFLHEIPVLIRGETGTGKEVMARWLHRHGPRPGGPFVALNCSAIPAGLIESELFGYEAGAFTGARRTGQVGKVEQAQGGTLFLDEIGDMPVALQARLLRVLQEREVMRLGAERGIPVHCALICATHRNLEQAVEEGSFRQDLYYRVNGLQLLLPPLRQRQDFDALVQHLLARTAAPLPPPVLSAAAWAALRAHAWPGNVRELEQVLKLMCALTDSGCIDVDLLPASMTRVSEEVAGRLDGGLQRAERETIRMALAEQAGNLSAAARSLGIARATLYRKMRQFGLASSGGAPSSGAESD